MRDMTMPFVYLCLCTWPGYNLELHPAVPEAFSQSAAFLILDSRPSSPRLQPEIILAHPTRRPQLQLLQVGRVQVGLGRVWGRGDWAVGSREGQDGASGASVGQA